MISDNITYFYGNYWSVVCTIDEHGDSYFNPMNNSLVGLVVFSNSYNFFFNIFLSAYGSNSSLTKQLETSQFTSMNSQKIKRREEYEKRILSGTEEKENNFLSQGNLGAAYLNQTLYVGNGISSYQQKSMVNIVLNTANNYNLSINRTNGECTVCYSVAESIDLYLQSYYGVYWSTSVIQQYYGDSYLPYFNGKYL